MKDSAATEVWEPHSTEAVGPLSTQKPLFDRKVPMAAPKLSATEGLLEEFRRVLESPQLTNGHRVAELEERAAVALDVPHCVAVSSCTSGLMLAARCLHLEGQVIVPSFTFFATAHSLLWNGLEPVLVDCEPQSFGGVLTVCGVWNACGLKAMPSSPLRQHPTQDLSTHKP